MGRGPVVRRDTFIYGKVLENKEHPASERGEEEVRDSSSSSLSQKTEYEPTPSTSRTSTEAQNTSLLEENPYVGVDGTVHGRSAPEADASDNGDDGRNWDSVLTNIRRIENNRYGNRSTSSLK